MKRMYYRRCWVIVNDTCHPVITDGYMTKYGFYVTEPGWNEESYSKSWKEIKKRDIFYNKEKCEEVFIARYGRRSLTDYLEDELTCNYSSEEQERIVNNLFNKRPGSYKVIEEKEIQFYMIPWEEEE